MQLYQLANASTSELFVIFLGIQETPIENPSTLQPKEVTKILNEFADVFPTSLPNCLSSK